MKSVMTVTAADLERAVIDTRFDVRVVEITDAERTKARLVQLYGERGFDIKDGEIYIEGNDSLFKERYSDGDLVNVMDRLTAENGCPWDRAQTHESIRVNAIEEAYELSEAIDAGDTENLKEETGDLLLQAVFHSNIAERSGEFTRLDVIDALVRKLVSRHTHIFGSDKAVNADDALKHWEAAKAKEKHAEDLSVQLARIPDAFPALIKAQKTVKKLVKNGLVNDCAGISVRELLFAVCGALKSGADLEPELVREVNALARAYLDGKVTAISGYED